MVAVKKIIPLKLKKKLFRYPMLFDDFQPPLPKHLSSYVQVLRTLRTASIDLGYSFSSIVKLPGGGAKPPAETPYSQLVCTDVDKANIAYIITTIGENGKLSLLFKSREIKQVGAEINHVHPLKFIATVVTYPNLKEFMREIYEDHFKWNGVMDGLGPSLTNHANQGKLDLYLKDFAKEVNVSPESIRGYFQSKDWEGLVYFLINT